MSRLFVVVGLPGAGKTTPASSLAARLSADGQRYGWRAPDTVHATGPGLPP